MTDYTDEKLIAQYHGISRFIFGRQAELQHGWTCTQCGHHHPGIEKPTAGLEAIKAELFKRLVERKADSTKTESGTAYFTHHLNVKVVDRDALLAFAQQHWNNGGGQLVVIRPPVDAVRDWQAMHDNALPPGIETSTFTRINIRGGK